MKPKLPGGLTVRYRHYRRGVSSKGGATVATLFLRRTNEAVAMGFAYCHYKDNFNRRIGRDISLGRALKDWGTGVPPLTLEEFHEWEEAHGFNSFTTIPKRMP